VDPSVVYQIETFPIGTGVVLLVFPPSVKVTGSGKPCGPEAGEMVGIVVEIAEHEEENVLPVALGGGMPRKPSDLKAPPMFGPHAVL
jgi:hypothetical protein